MFKLTVLLCGGLLAAMLVGGQDRGQVRFGLLATPADPVAVAPAVVDSVATAQPQTSPTPDAAADAPAGVTNAAFAPAEPLMVAPEPDEAAPVEAAADAPALQVLQVNSKTANVRVGPGKDFAVISKLSKGETVLVVTMGEGPEGWSLIRIEGDGVEGYIASRLLSE